MPAALLMSLITLEGSQHERDVGPRRAAMSLITLEGLRWGSRRPAYQLAWMRPLSMVSQRLSRGAVMDVMEWSNAGSAMGFGGSA